MPGLPRYGRNAAVLRQGSWILQYACEREDGFKSQAVQLHRTALTATFKDNGKERILTPYRCETLQLLIAKTSAQLISSTWQPPALETFGQMVKCIVLWLFLLFFFYVARWVSCVGLMVQMRGMRHNETFYTKASIFSRIKKSQKDTNTNNKKTNM